MGEAMFTDEEIVALFSMRHPLGIRLRGAPDLNEILLYPASPSAYIGWDGSQKVSIERHLGGWKYHKWDPCANLDQTGESCDEGVNWGHADSALPIHERIEFLTPLAYSRGILDGLLSRTVNDLAGEILSGLNKRPPFVAGVTVWVNGENVAHCWRGDSTCWWENDDAEDDDAIPISTVQDICEIIGEYHLKPTSIIRLNWLSMPGSDP